MKKTASNDDKKNTALERQEEHTRINLTALQKV